MKISKKHIFLTTLLFGAAASQLATAQSPKESFADFRKNMFKDYNEFKTTLLENYADFLNGEWHEYQSLNAVKRYKQPKPDQAPVASPAPETKPSPETKPAPKPQEQPKPTVADKPKPQPQEKPKPTVTEKPKPQEQPKPTVAEKPKPQPQEKPQPTVTEKPKPQEQPKPTVAEKPKPQEQPSPVVAEKPKPQEQPRPSVAETPKPTSPANTFEMTFYDIPLQAPKIDFNIKQSLASTADYGKQWEELSSKNVASKAVPELRKFAQSLGLNDYLTFQLVRQYIDSAFKTKDISSRYSAAHYLLANMGYAVRIGATSDGVPVLLVHFDRMVYARPYMVFDDGVYYIFGPDDADMSKFGSKKIYTCQIPADLEKGKHVNLTLGKLNLPEKKKHFELKGGKITLEGDVNENLMPVIYHYPQMPMDGYAVSNLQPELRADLCRQLKEQLKDVDGDVAVNMLLDFMHKAFEYSTDDNFHGFEKPYFLEETLYYPKNDCEDRAIFYTYFLWNALGREAQLLGFPGHEAASVRMNKPVSGSSLKYQGDTYYISDPTYLGSKTGMVMPEYVNDNPEVDYTYKK